MCVPFPVPTPFPPSLEIITIMNLLFIIPKCVFVVLLYIQTYTIEKLFLYVFRLYMYGITLYVLAWNLLFCSTWRFKNFSHINRCGSSFLFFIAIYDFIVWTCLNLFIQDSVFLRSLLARSQPSSSNERIPKDYQIGL